MIALPPVGVHAAAEEIFGLAATEDDISRSSFAPANAAARSCPLTRSRWSDCVHWSDERSSRTPRKWGCATAKSAHEKSHVCSSATAETASPRYALLYPELSTLPQRPSEKSGMSVCKNLQEVSRYIVRFSYPSFELARWRNSVHSASRVTLVRVYAGHAAGRDLGAAAAMLI